jgi:L-threonylcarbamoyladenylate synthase
VTRVVAIDPGALLDGRGLDEAGQRAIADAVALLRAGELVAFPTETVYGLGARALDEAAIARVFEAKGRPKSHPLIAHVAGESDARALAGEWSARASRLARAFWPGPLTLVVPRSSRVPGAIAGGGDSIALRAPSHPVARALIVALGEAIAAPSANRYQSISPTLAEHVVKSLGDRVALVIDGGPCESGIESTVVDVRGPRALVLRPGALSLAALREVEPGIEAASQSIALEDATRASPGMDPRHYAPDAELRLVSREQARRAASEGDAGVIVRDHPGSPNAPRVRVLPDDPVAFAAQLYAALHALDDLGVDAILVEEVPPDESWTAVRDRLRRAAHG